MKFLIIGPSEYLRRRDELKGFIEQAVSHSDLTLATVEDDIRTRVRLPVTCNIDNSTCGLMVMEKAGKRLHITTIAGAFDRAWPWDALRALKLMACLFRCDTIALRGRKGWERMLSPLGFKKEGLFLEYEVT